MNKEEYIEEGINGQWTNWKFEAENYKKVCDDLYKKVKQLETNRDEAIAILEYYLIGNMKYKDSQEQFKRLKTTLERGKE